MCLCTSGVDLIFKEKIRCTEVFYFKGYAAERQRKKTGKTSFWIIYCVYIFHLPVLFDQQKDI